MDWKNETKKQWNKTPCGVVNANVNSLDYYLKVEDYRYNQYGIWMNEFYNYKNHKGIKLLEVGFGQGTDLVQYAMGGADCYGVDITQKHFDLARKNFELRGLKAKLFLEDASKMHFEDDFFDKVVSFGVLHHTPDIEMCIQEIRRVLRPGGVFVMTLYHKWSFFYLLKIIRDGIFRGQLFSIGYDGLKATIEKGADGKHIKPFVALYTKKKVKKILPNFNIKEISIKHLQKSHVWPFGRFLPKKFIDFLEPYFGWYIISVVKKDSVN